ncbi:MAG: hypothetical protein AAFV07_21350, partial [Bacteroidota bacterium]
MTQHSRLLITFFLIYLIGGSVYAQRGATQYTSGSYKPYTGEALSAFDLREKKTEGSTFWNDSWLQGAVKMKSGGVIDGYAMRFDISNESLDFQIGSDVKTVPLVQVAEFMLQDPKGIHRFVDATKFFGLSATGYAGFFELFVEGPVSFLSKMDLEVQKGNYVAALDAGDINDKIIKKEVFYLVKDNSLIVLPKNKKKRFAVLSEMLPELDSVLKE